MQATVVLRGRPPKRPFRRLLWAFFLDLTEPPSFPARDLASVISARRCASVSCSSGTRFAFTPDWIAKALGFCKSALLRNAGEAERTVRTLAAEERVARGAYGGVVPTQHFEPVNFDLSAGL